MSGGTICAAIAGATHVSQYLKKKKKNTNNM